MISQEELQFVGMDFKWIVEPGQFHIIVGGNSEAFLMNDLYVVSKK